MLLPNYEIDAPVRYRARAGSNGKENRDIGKSHHPRFAAGNWKAMASKWSDIRQEKVLLFVKYVCRLLS
jgi:hypothetical protein